MQFKKISIAVVWLSFIINANAQSTVIKITGTKFPFGIMQQWIDVYSKTHPAIQFQLSKSIPADSADLLIAAHAFREGELSDEQTIVAVNRYAQLPIANINRQDIAALKQKGFTTRDLKVIYFEQSDENKTDALNEPVHVYRRDKKVCASRSFAEKVTGNFWDVAGILVTGDDQSLSDAVKHDVYGISYNNLGLVYNLKTRKINDSIAVVPIDLNEDGKIDASENIYTTLDDVLNFLSASNNNSIPQDNVNIVINKNKTNAAALDFLKWIITDGQQYNRAFGFLNIDDALAKQEQQLLTTLSKNYVDLTITN